MKQRTAGVRMTPFLIQGRKNNSGIMIAVSNSEAADEIYERQIHEEGN